MFVDRMVARDEMDDIAQRILDNGEDAAAVAQDFVDAVFGRANLDGWKDADDLSAYLDAIHCEKNDYAAFIRRTTPWQEWEDSPHFGAYYRTFDKSATLRNVRKTRAYKSSSQEGKQLDEDLAFYRYAHAEERERLRVFALVRGERTLVVNSPTQTSEIAAFLGYKWSNRKGNEGIQIIDEGGVLYANGSMSEEPKLCDVIRTWFAGEVLEAGDLSQYFYYADTQDFIDFDGEKHAEDLLQAACIRSWRGGGEPRGCGELCHEDCEQGQHCTRFLRHNREHGEGQDGSNALRRRSSGIRWDRVQTRRHAGLEHPPLPAEDLAGRS